MDKIAINRLDDLSYKLSVPYKKSPSILPLDDFIKTPVCKRTLARKHVGIPRPHDIPIQLYLFDLHFVNTPSLPILLFQGRRFDVVVEIEIFPFRRVLILFDVERRLQFGRRKVAHRHFAVIGGKQFHQLQLRFHAHSIPRPPPNVNRMRRNPPATAAQKAVPT